MKEKNKNKNVLNNNNNNKLIVERIISDEMYNFLHEDENYLKNGLFYKAFIEPFTDVVSTVKHGVQKVGTSTVGNLKKLIKQSAIAALPFVASKEISRIGKEEDGKIKQALSSIDNKYSNVLARNWDTLRGRDVNALGFLLNPGAFLGVELLKKSGPVALDVLDIMTGGNSELVKKAKHAFDEVNKTTSIEPSKGSTMDFGGAAGYDLGDAMFGGYGESYNNKKAATLKEDNNAPNNTKLLNNLLSNPEVQQQIKTGPIYSTLQQAAINIITDRLKLIDSLKSYEDLKKYAGNELEQKVELPENLTPEQLDQYKQALVPELKKSYYRVYINFLSKLSKSAFNKEIANQANSISQALSKLL